MKKIKLRKNMCVRSKTTGHKGKIIKIEKGRGMVVEVKWKGKATPGTYQYKEDLKRC